MQALLSAVGTRGDVQPIVALALRVRALRHAVRLCVPPNFVGWVAGFGFEAIAVGVEMRHRAGAPATMPDLIADQFDAVGAAAEGCDVILGGNAHQYAARSIAELRGIPYVTALYAPVAIPSADHAPPGQTWAPGDAATNVQRWADNTRAWNQRALERVNHNRARLGLASIDDVLRYNVTDRPWLAADALLGPAPAGIEVVQTGAWILEDSTPLAHEVEYFLEAGHTPVYAGFGSMPAPEGLSRAVVDAARAVGRRLVFSRGWAELRVGDELDHIAVDDVNQQTLFPRVAAVIHHGGAGTTAAAARAGVPQVVVPMFGDQHYWASRVRALGIGAAVVSPTTENLAMALREALDPVVCKRARSVARWLSSDGADIAARLLIAR